MYLPAYCSFRMTDIWRSFVAQRIAWENGWNVLFREATVRQRRNPHDLMRDFRDEVPGYVANREICAALQALELEPGTLPDRGQHATLVRAPGRPRVGRTGKSSRSSTPGSPTSRRSARRRGQRWVEHVRPALAGHEPGPIAHERSPRSRLPRSCSSCFLPAAISRHTSTSAASSSSTDSRSGTTTGTPAATASSRTASGSIPLAALRRDQGRSHWPPSPWQPRFSASSSPGSGATLRAGPRGRSPSSGR